MQNPNTGLTVLQLNCHLKTQVNSEVDKWMSKQTTAIALLQEPGQNKGKIKNFSKDKTIMTGTENAEKCRTCIVASPDLKIFKLSQFSNKDHTTVILKNAITNDKFVFSSVYMPYDSPTTPPDELMKNLVEHCQTCNLKLIIGSDTNCHNEIWGSSDNNSRGDDLLEYIVSTNLHICNTGNSPTFINVIRQEVLDVTLVSQNAIEHIAFWEVLNKDMLSDHRAISFEVNFEIEFVESTYRNVRTTDWDKFRLKLRDELGDVNENEGINEQTESLNKAIKIAYNENCREKKRKKGGKPDWWDKELTELKNDYRQKRKEYMRDKTEEKRIERNQADEKYKKKLDGKITVTQ